MNRETKFTNALVIRIPKELREALERDAEDNGRTVSQSVRFHLARTLNRYLDGTTQAP